MVVDFSPEEAEEYLKQQEAVSFSSYWYCILLCLSTNNKVKLKIYMFSRPLNTPLLKPVKRGCMLAGGDVALSGFLD